MDNNSQNKISNKKVIHQLINLAVKHRKIMQNNLDETGVYQSQHRLLMEISRNPNASQVDLARLMHVSPAAIAVSLKKLEKEGYINRGKDEDDNRLNKITITNKGNRIVEQSKKIFESTEKRVFEGFTEEEKSTLFALLKKLNVNLLKMEDQIKLERERT